MMRRVLLLVVPLAVAASIGAATPAANAYGGGATHDMWQVGLSGNCNNPSVCGDELGGFWGWAEFDRAGTQTWGDAELAFCGHQVGGGGPFSAGAGHGSIEIESWTIEPGSAGPQTFFASGEETDSFGGQRETFDFVHMDTGIPATPGHYSTVDLLGFSAPGVAFQIQVAYRAAK
jgi:hypothetical protein